MVSATHDPNSIDLQQSLNNVQQTKQEPFVSFTNNPQNVLPASSAAVISNGLFPSTIVGSSVSVGSSNQGSFGSSNQGSSDNNRLPPGSAGFGTVEAIDLGSVFINPTQQTLNTIEPQSQSLQVVSNNQGSFGSSNQGSFGSSNQGTFGSNNQGSLFTPVQPQSQSSNPGSFGSSNQGSFGSSNQGSFGQSFTPLQSANAVEQSQESFLKLTNPQQPNVNSFQQHNPNFHQSQNLDVLPSYGQTDTNVNIAVIPSNNQGSFGSAFTPNEKLPTYGNRPQPSQTFFPNNGNNDLPNYVQPIANQFGRENFQSSLSTPLAWKGANQQQQFLHNGDRLPSINSQTNLTPGFSPRPNDNERPVRFPGDASNRFDTSYETSYEDYDSYNNSPYEQYAGNGFKNEDYYVSPQQTAQQQIDYYNSQESQQTPNIVAELTKYSKKNNLVHRPRSDNSYISYPSSHEMEEPDKELIFYPSGQLVVGQSPNIGPNLRQHLLSSSNSHPISYQSANINYRHDQAPHYVVARKKPAYEGKTEMFDPMLEGDELIERSDNESEDEEENEGILPVLIRTAKDDFKLVGDVIKMAFSKR